jgi:hypothetical protein
MNVMKKFAMVAAVTVVIALQSVAYAGAHWKDSVSVYSSSSGGYGIGSVSTARYYTSDSSEYIGCSAATDTVSSTYIYCSATNSSGTFVGCYTSSGNEAARQAVAAINTTSLIFFEVNSAGQCTYLTVENYSSYL